MKQKKRHEDDGKVIKYCKECFCTTIERRRKEEVLEIWDPDNNQWVEKWTDSECDEECDKCGDWDILELTVGGPGYVYPGERKAVLIQQFHWDEWLLGEDGEEYFLDEGSSLEIDEEEDINTGDLVILEKVDHFKWKFVFDKAMEATA